MKKLIWIIPLAVFLLLPYELFVYNEEFLIAMNMLRGLVVMAAFYCAIIWLYFLMRRKIDKKYVPEITIVSVALAISVVGKVLAIVMQVDECGNVSLNMPENGLQAVAAMYYSLYQAIGGLSFEGLAGYDYYENWRTIIYAGTSVLAGLVAVSIITFSFSYEIYSTVSWMTTRKRNRKIYVFTAVTEDSVMLAHSIADHHAGLKKKGKKQKYIIIFLRTEGQEGFDGKNPLHLDIMHSGFLFRSYSPGKKNKSIPEFLKINVKNDYCLQKDAPDKYKAALKADAAPEVHIFALDWEKGKTSENDKLVCEDVARVTARLFGRKLTLRQKIKLRMAGGQQDVGVLTPEFVCRMNGLRMIINYHYLVNEDIDTSNVDMRFENEVSKFAPGGEYDSDAKRSEALRTIGILAKKCLYDDVYEAKTRTRSVKEKAETEAKAVVDTVANANELKEIYKTAAEHVKTARQTAKEVENLAEKVKKEAEEDIGEKERKAFLDYKCHFVFDAINEANMAAFSYVRKRADLIKECQELYDNDVKEEKYRVLVIGFGQNGQQTMKLSYIFAAAGDHDTRGNIEENRYFSPTEDDDHKDWTKQLQRSELVNYVPQPFIADVYDKNASDVGGLFRMKHPSIRVDMPQSTSGSYRYDYVPIKVRLHHESAYSNTILNTLDDNMGPEYAHTGNDKKEKEKEKYNLIIIALGDDDSNVNIANAILEDSKHEELSPDKGVKDRWQVIAINLRNRLNYDRINWQEKDEKIFKRIKVIRFGSSEEMYSYDNIVDTSLAKQWNQGYNMILSEDKKAAGNGNTEKSVKEKMRKAVAAEIATDGKETNRTTISELLEAIGDNDTVETEHQWATHNFKPEMYYSRVSSSYACEMPAFIKAYSIAKEFCNDGDFKSMTADKLVQLGAVEHDRWVRYMVSFGFKKGKRKELYFKEHPCIDEYRYLNSQPNDMVNVLNAFKDREKSGSDSEEE